MRRSDTFEGELLSFLNVDRRHFGAYLCIAKNEVPPAVSKRVFLNVNCKAHCDFLHIPSINHFFLAAAVAPNVTILNEKSVHVLERSHIDVECIIEASPRARPAYWIKEPLGRSFHQSLTDDPGQNVLQEGDKYSISESVSHYRTTMRMRISNFSESDVGVYTCIASNVMGRDNSTIRLYGK